MEASFADVLAAALAENPAEAPAATKPGFEPRLASSLIAIEDLLLPPWAKTLNVSPFSNERDLRRAYKRRAFETHPDRGGSAAPFIAAKAALDEALASLLEKHPPQTARAAAAYR